MRPQKNRGGMSEKVLWTNPNPTSPFTNTTVNLSDDMTKYDYIRVESRKSTSNDARYDTLMRVSQFTTTEGFGLIMVLNGSPIYCRRCFKNSNTSMAIGGMVEVYGTRSDNTYGIPLKIYGVKVS